MLRYKTETRPGLVTLYDIRPGNGAGPFLQPRSPHGAYLHRITNTQQDSRLTAVFHDDPSISLSPFWILLELRMVEVVSGDNWSYNTRKAPVK